MSDDRIRLDLRVDTSALDKRILDAIGGITVDNAVLEANPRANPLADLRRAAALIDLDGAQPVDDAAVGLYFDDPGIPRALGVDVRLSRFAPRGRVYEIRDRPGALATLIIGTHETLVERVRRETLAATRRAVAYSELARADDLRMRQLTNPWRKAVDDTARGEALISRMLDAHSHAEEWRRHR
jgi:hypothetical protein